MALASIYGCKKSSTSAAIYCDPAISYSKTVKPILVTNCTQSNCHDGNNLTSLANYDIAHGGAAQIKSDVISGRMPRGGSLNSTDKSAIICWIDNGARNN
ncbi:MAG: hypothetical protein H7098_11825 [Oligoflexus sp.]|nr:hypothetical protein [Pseudopedobacter sp.]